MSKDIKVCRRKGRLVSVYLPAWVFGPVVLDRGPCKVLMSLTRELTREAGRPRGAAGGRQDKAQIIPAGSDPLIAAAEAHVGFNGNAGRGRAHLHGHGYRLAERMRRAGFPYDPAAPSFPADARRFLKALRSLAGPFGLVVACRDGTGATWRNLDAAVEDAGVVPARRLAESLVRVYTAADYLDRWRACFAARLGVSAIPRGLGGGPATPLTAAPDLPAAFETGEDLARWMKRSGTTDAGLAVRLGVSRSYVTKCRRPGRRLPRSVQEQLAEVVAEQSVLKFDPAV